MKTISLLKAALSQDMNMFKYSAKRNSSKIKKIMFPIFLFVLVSFSIGTYAYMIAEKLAPFNLTYVMLSMFVIMVTMLTFIGGIYKSQGILFDAKDNDLLFSLPIKRTQILFVRIFKLYLFEFIYNLMFILPALCVYGYFVKPSISFYILSILMTILIPIIPAVISCFIGYLIKLLSAKSKKKRLIQTILSGIVFIAFFYLSFNIETFIENIADKATSINDMLTKIYYPLGLYINLITNFKILDLLKLLLVNIIPLLIFIMIGSIYYFKIIFKSKEISIIKKTRKGRIKSRKPIISLARKELKRYLSSPIYMFNTGFGLLILITFTIYLCYKGGSALSINFENFNFSDVPISVFYYFFILVVGFLTSISSSSISLEGKTMNITKSLPVSEIDILNSKILACFIIELPFMLFSSLLFFIRFKVTFFYIILILLISILSIFINATIGLIVNLKYPKMNASNDTEIVKQSISSVISVFIGMFIVFISIVSAIYLNKYYSLDYILLINITVLLIIALISYILLIKWGEKEYKQINV